MSMRWRVLLMALVLLQACQTPDLPPDSPAHIHIPVWFPDPVYPDDNMPTRYRVELGRRLFYSTSLSSDGTVSCGSCHVPSAAFTDGRRVSPGAHGRLGRRNAPTLANVAWNPCYMMECGVPTLELQALAPLADSAEMDRTFSEIFRQLEEDPLISRLSRAAYGRAPDAFVITRALACFQRTFVSGDSGYDRYRFGGRADQLSPEAVRGMELFFSDRLACARCHPAPFFTDFDFHNIGLYARYDDTGRERVTYNPEDSGKFRTPTLRNIALTAPYMHDGSLESLEDVVTFYSEGGVGHRIQDPAIRPLNLTGAEQRDLVAFLHSLTDWNFVQNHTFLPLEE